ncbi:MAG: hypothetical protein ACOYU3_04685 [Bacillota bacterium]
MKRIWIPLAIALLLLAGCIPQTGTGNAPQPTVQQTAQATAAASVAASVAATPTIPAQTATPAWTPSASAPAYWPSQIPASVPVFTYGQHVQTTVYGGEVTIVFSGVSKENYAEYRDKLKSAGFYLADESIEPVGVSEFTMNGSNCVITLRVTKDDYAELKYTPAG